MRSTSQRMQQQMPPRVRVRVEHEGQGPSESFFTEAFRIGRGEPCEVRIQAALVSRIHAEVVLEGGTWWIRDLGSTNGLYVNGERVERAGLEGEVAVQLGRNGPLLTFCVEAAGAASEVSAGPRPSRVEPARADAILPARRGTEPERDAASAWSSSPHGVPPTNVPPPPQQTPPAQIPPPENASVASSPRAAHHPPDPSLSQIIGRYFDADDSRPAGEHTRMIRQAYATVKKKEKRKYTGIIAGVLVLLVLALGYAIFQRHENARQRRLADEVFLGMKAIDLQIARLRMAYEQNGQALLEDQLASIEAERREQARRYDGLVRELGLYRRLNEEEQRIYRLARIFNESQVDIPAGFIREVRETIQQGWLTAGGRATFEQALHRAKQRNYIPYIVRVFQDHGLPPQFVYLALQESKFDVHALGWYSHPQFGRAKGMWQFIPETARRYNLFVPERKQNANEVVPGDERNDFEKSTAAAAAYLQEIYTTLAQASGLLAMASYNWGEGRVVRRMSELKGLEEINEADLPETPRDRSYWNFLRQYEKQIPDQTKEYVLKIFAAAVIGEDPRAYGFDFDDPLKPYMESPTASAD